MEGDTIVVASGEEDQQCVFVTEDGHQVMQRTNEDGSTVLTLESAYADAVAQLVPNQVTILMLLLSRFYFLIDYSNTRSLTCYQMVNTNSLNLGMKDRTFSPS